MGCFLSSLCKPCLHNLSHAWKQQLPELPDGIVRLDTRLPADLLVKAKQVLIESFAGTTTNAPEGTMSWTIDSEASIDNDPSKPLKQPPTEERLACFKWVVEFLFAVELRYGACFLLVEGEEVVSVALLIPPNTKDLHEPNACIMTSAGCEVGEPPAPWNKGASKAKFDALAAAMSKVHHEVMHKQKHWYLHMFGTSPHFQGKGYGSKLMKFLVSLSDIYLVPMYLETTGDGCISFYNKHGFEVSKKSKELFILEDKKRFPGEKLQGVAMVRQPIDKDGSNVVAVSK